MFVSKFVKWFLVSAVIVTLTACGGSSSADPTAQEIAIEEIATYAQNGGTAPTVEDYLTAGVEGVNAENIDQINEVVEGLEYDDVDTQEEIQAIADELGITLSDVTPPVITLVGDAVVNIAVGTAYTDAGATANDNIDGNITGNIVTVNPVDSNTVGTYTVTYNVSDAAGNAATEVSRTVNIEEVLDTTAPTLEEVTAVPTPTNDATPNYTFSSDEAGTITYGGACTSGIPTAAIAGNNTITFDALADGTYSDCIITVTDAAVNASTPLAVATFVVDTTAPAVATTSAPLATLANQAAYPVSGTCTAGDGDVTVGIAGATPATQDVACTAGTWSAAFDVNAIGDGTDVIDVAASQTDAAGNTGTATLVEASKDATAPAVATTSAPLATLANQAAYPVSGTCTAGDGDVTVGIAGATPATQDVACTAGTWSAAFDVNAIGDGTDVIDVAASQTDAAGNTGTATLVEASKDATAPTLEEVTAVPTPIINTIPAAYTFSSDEAGTIAYGGSCNSTLPEPAIVNNNTITFTAPVGTYSDCTITVTDAAGNPSTPLAVTEFVVVAPLSPDTTTLSSGDSHTVEIRSGYLYAWGRNNNGQLGDGTTVDKHNYTTQIASAGNGWVSVSAGGDSRELDPHDREYDPSNPTYDGPSGYTVAINDQGQLWSWGDNTYGQLGRTGNPTTPGLVGTDTDWVSVSTGDRHTVAIKSNGTLWAWGRNNHGQLGLGDTIDRSSPVRITAAGDGWVSVSAGGDDDTGHPSGHTVAIKVDGTLWAWGNNAYGQLGNNTQINENEPIKITIHTDWDSVSAGDCHTVAIRDNGMGSRTLWTWGWDAFGQLGNDGLYTDQHAPVQEDSEATDWESVSAGSWHTVAIRSGQLWSWGRNTYGQLGNGTTNGSTVNSPYPVHVGVDTPAWSSVSAGGHYTVAIKTGGTHWTWGDNYYGQLGNGTITDKHDSIQEHTGETWNSVSAGGHHTVAIKTTDDSLWAWGRNEWGQLGNGSRLTKVNPTQESEGKVNWSMVTTGFEHTAAIDLDGTLWTWGRNLHGQLGNEVVLPGTWEVDPISLAGTWKSVASGGWHTVAINTTNQLYTWGYNNHGQLGNDSLVSSSTPILVDAGTDFHWDSASAADNHTVAIKVEDAVPTNRTLWAWGWNHDGQLGDGTQTDTETPKQVGNNETDWQSVSVSDYHNAAIKTDGTLWTWGLNNHGQLGLGDTTIRLVPEKVNDDMDWVSVSTGDYHTVAVKENGDLYAWGWNNYGQLCDSAIGTQITTPNLIDSTSVWGSISGGDFFTVAINSDGKLWACGDNEFAEVHTWVTVPTVLP